MTAGEIDHQRAAVLAKARAELGALSAKATGDADRFLPMVERGDAARLIVDSARAVDADLLVLGEWLLGSVARHVLADVDCDVLQLGL